MYVPRRCSVFSGASPLPADWAASVNANFAEPLSRAIADARQVWRQMVVRSDLDGRGMPRSAVSDEEQVTGQLLANGQQPSAASMMASKTCSAVRVAQQQILPPPADPAVLPAVTLEAAEICEGLARGTIRPAEIAPEMLIECAAAGYIGAAQVPAGEPVETDCDRLRRGEIVTWQGKAALEAGRLSRNFIHRCEQLMYNEPGAETERRACASVGLHGNYPPCRPALTTEAPDPAAIEREARFVLYGDPNRAAADTEAADTDTGMSGMGQIGGGGMRLLAFGVAALLIGPTMLKAIRERD